MSPSIFLFCQGTDPELILLLEARQTGDCRAWHFAVASFTDYGLNVTLDKEVWSLIRGHRPTLSSPHWWNGRMEDKTLSTEEEAALASRHRSQKRTTPDDKGPMGIRRGELRELRFAIGELRFVRPALEFHPLAEPEPLTAMLRAVEGRL